MGKTLFSLPVLHKLFGKDMAFEAKGRWFLCEIYYLDFLSYFRGTVHQNINVW